MFDDLDDQVHYWNTLLTNIIDECLPSKKMRVRTKDVPYMTSNWKNAIRAKRKALANYYRDKSNFNWDKLRKSAMKPRDRGEEQSSRIGGKNRIILRRTQQISIDLLCYS